MNVSRKIELKIEHAFLCVMQRVKYSYFAKHYPKYLQKMGVRFSGDIEKTGFVAPSISFDSKEYAKYITLGERTTISGGGIIIGTRLLHRCCYAWRRCGWSEGRSFTALDKGNKDWQRLLYWYSINHSSWNNYRGSHDCGSRGGSKGKYSSWRDCCWKSGQDHRNRGRVCGEAR